MKKSSKKIIFKRGSLAAYSSAEIEFGPILLNEKSATFKEKYQARIDEIERLLHNSHLPNKKIICLNNEKEKILNIIQ